MAVEGRYINTWIQYNTIQYNTGIRGHHGSLLGLYSSDQELNINELWSVGTVRNNLANIVIVGNVNSHLGTVHKVHHAIFGQFWPRPPVTLFHTSSGPPKSSLRHTSRTPILVGLVQKAWTKPPVQILSQLSFCAEGFSGGLLSGRFCPGWFLSVPPSVRIFLLQQTAKHHFKFQVLYVC